MKVRLFLTNPDKGTLFLKSSGFTPPFASGEYAIKMKKGLVQWGSTGRRIQVPLCHSYISHGLARQRSRISEGDFKP